MIKNHDYNQTQPDENPEDLPYDYEETDLSYPKTGFRLGLILTVVGYFIFLLGARPSLFGLDRSRVIGFVQISVFLVGLAFMSLGGYTLLNSFWTNGKKTIAADIGSRLISTGYVISVFTAMADIFGLGSHPLPNVYFGPLQARGMGIGLVTIAIGFLLLIQYKHLNNHKNLPNNGDDKEEKTPENPLGNEKPASNLT
jgi:hypothetical protein